MARAMCVADGHDPDQPTPCLTAPPPGDPVAPAMARWRAYESRARSLVAAQTTLLAES